MDSAGQISEEGQNQSYVISSKLEQERGTTASRPRLGSGDSRVLKLLVCFLNASLCPHSFAMRQGLSSHHKVKSVSPLLRTWAGPGPA